MILTLAVETTEAAAPAEFGLGDVLGTAAMGMLIVFVVLLLITTFIATLPKALEAVAGILPEPADTYAPADHSENLLPNEAMLAAIGYVLHKELQREVGSGDSG